MSKLSDPVYLIVRDLFAGGYNREVVDIVEKLPLPWADGIAFYAVAALINLEDTALARHYLSSTLPKVKKVEYANLLALDGLLAAYRGDTDTYMSKASEANGLSSSTHTLYHLGSATTEPDKRLLIFQASLIEAEGAGDRYAEARSAGALASATAALGRLKEALDWAQFALDRTTHPGLRLTAINLKALLEIYSGETTNLEAMLIAAYDASEGEAYSRQKTQVRTTLADLYQATERYGEAEAIYGDELRRAPRALRSWLVLGYVRALCALGREAEAVAWARATASVTSELSEYHRQTTALALGTALWPTDEALEPLVSAFEYFKNKNAISATEAAIHLGALESQNSVLDELRKPLVNIMPQLTAAGVRLLAGRTLMRHREVVGQITPLRLFMLGKEEMYIRGSATRIRRRSLELLTLLLSRPHGYEPELLSEELYGNAQGAALRVELHRLRKELGVQIKSRPYRIVSPVWADMTELGDRLRQGRVRDAVALYRGPLLPASESPGIVELRGWLEAEVRATVLAANDTDAIWELAQIMPFDLELWEVLARNLATDDPRRNVAAGKSARVRLELNL